MSDASEFSPSGSPIRRYEKRKTSESARGSDENVEVIANHIEKHIGPPDWVYPIASAFRSPTSFTSKQSSRTERRERLHRHDND